MLIQPVSDKNIQEVNDFLSRYEETSQFLVNNLELHGPVLTSHHNSGNFKLVRKDDAIEAVFCLSRRGNLLIQSKASYFRDILEECSKEVIKLKGFVGDWKSVSPLFQEFKKQNPGYVPTYESKEILYSYSLTSSDSKLKHDPRVRLMEDSDFPQWLEFSRAYMSELSLPDDLTDGEKRSSFESAVKEQVWWGLFEGGTLLSRTALNSKGTRVGQVGGVFTPKSHRKKGLAKATMFHMLKDCFDSHGHSKSILFTGETDIPAQKLYESIGYSRIGHFALILGA